MSWPEVIMYAIVIGVGMSTALCSMTSLALVISWAIGQGTYLATGDNLPLPIYIACDILVLTTMVVVHGSPREWSLSNKWVGIIFLCMWGNYLFNYNPYYQWWTLWYLAAAQFLVAGVGTFVKGGHFYWPFRRPEVVDRVKSLFIMAA